MTADATPVESAKFPYSVAVSGVATTVLGVAITASSLTSSLISQGSSIHGALLFVAAITVIAGLMVCVAAWLAFRNAKQGGELAAQHREMENKIDALAEMVKGLAAAPVDVTRKWSLDELNRRFETVESALTTLQASTKAKDERHLKEVEEAYELGRIVGPGEMLN